VYLALGIVCILAGSAMVYLGVHGLSTDTLAATNNGKNVTPWAVYDQLLGTLNGTGGKNNGP
jgi:hypothetical protein